MKFIGIILLLLTSIFLIACSANQASNQTNTSDIEELGKKYGGVYIFDSKFYNEINRREKERSDYMDDFFKNNKRNFKRDDLVIMDKKLPQILSNGKQYYLRSEYTKKVVMPDDAIVKLKSFMGETAYKHSSIMISDFYIDDEKLKVISLDVNFYQSYTKYGLFGDEGRGFSLSRKDIRNVSSLNRFILINNKFEKEK
jgi:putative lipoprotein